MIFSQPSRYRAWALGVLCLGACSGDSTKRPSQRGHDRDGGAMGTEDGGGDGDVDGADGGASSATWAVTLSADKVELCPGECTKLRALAPESDLELTYAWSAGLTGATEVEVCPTETTSYELTLSEVPTVGGDVTTERTSTDQLTVSVKSCDPESPVLCEARHRYDFPKDNNVLKSNRAWIASVAYHSTIQNTSDGGAVIIAAFGNRIDLGAGQLVSSSGANGLVHKYDKNCKSVWSRALAPSLSTDVLIPLSLATDKEDNVYVTSAGGPLLDLNPFTPLATTFATELVVQKFSSTGEPLYRKSFGVAAGYVYDSVVDDQGQLIVSGVAHNWTDFGGGPVGGPLGGSPTGVSTFVLKVNAQGNYLRQAKTTMYQMSRAGDRIVYLDTGYQGVDFLWVITGPPTYDIRLSSLSVDTLQDLWSLPVDRQNDPWPQLLLGYDDGRSIGILMENEYSEDGETLSYTWEVLPIAADGTRGQPVVFLRDEVETPDLDAGVAPRIFASSYVQQGERNAAGEMVLAGGYLGEWKVDSLNTTLGYDETLLEGNAYHYWPFAMKLDAQYNVVWLRAPEWGKRASLVGASMDAEGHAWLHGQGEVADSADGVAIERDMVITKMRSTP